MSNNNIMQSSSQYDAGFYLKKIITIIWTKEHIIKGNNNN